MTSARPGARDVCGDFLGCVCVRACACVLAVRRPVSTSTRAAGPALLEGNACTFTPSQTEVGWNPSSPGSSLVPRGTSGSELRPR